MEILWLVGYGLLWFSLGYASGVLLIPWFVDLWHGRGGHGAG